MAVIPYLVTWTFSSSPDLEACGRRKVIESMPARAKNCGFVAKCHDRCDEVQLKLASLTVPGRRLGAEPALSGAGPN
jgi:hypothetical protein